MIWVGVYFVVWFWCSFVFAYLGRVDSVKEVEEAVLWSGFWPVTIPYFLYVITIYQVIKK